MKLETVKTELWRIGSVYPTVRGILTKKIDGTDETIGHRWALLMQDLAPDHFANVVDDYASMRRGLPDPTDHLAQEIISEVRDAMALDQQRLDQHLAIHEHAQRHRAAPWRAEVPADLWCRCVKFLQQHPQRGENAANADILAAWGSGKGGPPPEFLTDDQIQRFFPNDFQAVEIG